MNNDDFGAQANEAFRVARSLLRQAFGYRALVLAQMDGREVDQVAEALNSLLNQIKLIENEGQLLAVSNGVRGLFQEYPTLRELFPHSAAPDLDAPTVSREIDMDIFEATRNPRRHAQERALELENAMVNLRDLFVQQEPSVESSQEEWSRDDRKCEGQQDRPGYV